MYVPSLPGCISEGYDTYEEALANVKEAIKGWIEVSEHLAMKSRNGETGSTIIKPLNERYALIVILFL